MLGATTAAALLALPGAAVGADPVVTIPGEGAKEAAVMGR
eukprot:gene37767-21025_t